jgi:hypothetical protein
MDHPTENKNLHWPCSHNTWPITYVVVFPPFNAKVDHVSAKLKFQWHMVARTTIPLQPNACWYLQCHARMIMFAFAINYYLNLLWACDRSIFLWRKCPNPNHFERQCNPLPWPHRDPNTKFNILQCIVFLCPCKELCWICRNDYMCLWESCRCW